jgi:cytidine deaminase
MRRGVNSSLIKKLQNAAVLAMKNAYCKYSRFPVGAAVETKDGSIFSGCNVENASYGLSICAERNAIFQAIAAGHQEIKTVCVVTTAKIPTSPCGACRQVIFEFGPNTRVVCIAKNGKKLRYTIRDLLPEAFSVRDLTSLGK